MRYSAAVFWILIFPLLLVAAGPKVELSLELDHGYYLSEQQNLIYLKASIHTTDEVDLENQVPINLALVVDRSGSMAGAPIEYARKALTKTLGSLSDRDVVSLITYGSKVETLIKAQPLGELKNRNILIQQIEAEGGSAPYEALNVAAAQLRRFLNRDSINRILFLTDGLATSGPREDDDFIRLAESFAREDISISTIGLGESFDEDLLKQMAEIGGGEFFIAESGEDLETVYLKEVQRLSTVFANNVTLEIRFSNGIRPKEIMGREGEIAGRTVRISLGQLLDYEKKFVLMSADIPGRFTYQSLIDVAEVVLSYSPASEIESETIEVQSSIQTRFAAHKPTVIKSINHGVVRSVVSHDIAESIQIAIDFADEGNLEKGIKELKGTLRDIKYLNFELEDDEIDKAMLDLQNYIQLMESRGLDRIDRKVMTLKVFQAIQQRSAGLELSEAETSNAPPEE